MSFLHSCLFMLVVFCLVFLVWRLWIFDQLYATLILLQLLFKDLFNIIFRNKRKLFQIKNRIYEKNLIYLFTQVFVFLIKHSFLFFPLKPEKVMLITITVTCAVALSGMLLIVNRHHREVLLLIWCFLTEHCQRQLLFPLTVGLRCFFKQTLYQGFENQEMDNLVLSS